MSQVVAIYWTEAALDYVVANSGQVVATGSVALPASLSARELGVKLSDALGRHLSGKARAIVALPRVAVEWNHLSLPPCPAEELPDLVRIQADRDPAASDEDVGFDYLPLVGDEQHPQEVIALQARPSDVETTLNACRAANLAVTSLVPLAIGLPSHAAQATDRESTAAQVYVAPLISETTIWATHGSKVVLLRQFPNSSADDVGTVAKSIGNQLRRTLLTLSQQEDFEQPAIALVDCGVPNAKQLAEQVELSVARPVSVIDAVGQQPGLRDTNDFAPQHVPLASLAIEASAGNAPLVDLLNPRRRPEPQVNYRTYALAAIAASLLVATLGWTAFATLNAPLNKAATDQAALDELSESLDELAADEENAAAIRNWLSETPNVLNHLRQVSQCLRPVDMAAENFAVSDDVMLEKMSLEKRQLVLDAVARGDQAVQPFETRLREADYSTQRGKSGVSKRNDYKWQFKSIIDIDATSDLTAQAFADSAKPEKAPDEEPAS